jgi:hypothetical protein
LDESNRFFVDHFVRAQSGSGDDSAVWPHASPLPQQGFDLTIRPPGGAG